MAEDSEGVLVEVASVGWKDVIEQAEWRSGEPLQDGLVEFYLSCFWGSLENW